MIIVSATCWPGGNAIGHYEMLHATIFNVSSPGDKTDTYISHVLARPDASRGLRGYEADVEVTGHRFGNGLSPLLQAVLGAAHGGPGVHSFGPTIPSSRCLVRVDIEQAAAFEKAMLVRS